MTNGVGTARLCATNLHKQQDHQHHVLTEAVPIEVGVTDVVGEAGLLLLLLLLHAAGHHKHLGPVLVHGGLCAGVGPVHLHDGGVNPLVPRVKTTKIHQFRLYCSELALCATSPPRSHMTLAPALKPSREMESQKENRRVCNPLFGLCPGYFSVPTDVPRTFQICSHVHLQCPSYLRVYKYTLFYSTCSIRQFSIALRVPKFTLLSFNPSI